MGESELQRVAVVVYTRNLLDLALEDVCVEIFRDSGKAAQFVEDLEANGYWVQSETGYDHRPVLVERVPFFEDGPKLPD